MVKLSSSPLDTIFHALSDPTRRAILRTLAEGDHSVGELAAPFNMSFAGASKHIKTLEQAGLVQRTVQGRNHICRLDPGPMAQVMQWLQTYEQFWTERLDALENTLRQAASDPPRSEP
ncbi:ArsR/SmtB family transcription factor [Serratia sp. NPDC078593]|uniref:ArsR/SmtB family transcription factor n=1 Tax=unclassified Serratia (in: enterobacteria) TaxID=2647522 RepID=UPI0037D05525